MSNCNLVLPSLWASVSLSVRRGKWCWKKIHGSFYFPPREACHILTSFGPHSYGIRRLAELNDVH